MNRPTVKVANIPCNGRQKSLTRSSGTCPRCWLC